MYLNATETTPDEEKEEPKSKIFIVILSVFGSVIIVVGIICLIVFLVKKGQININSKVDDIDEDKLVDN